MYKRINENEIEVYKSGIYENHKDYKSFLPSKINYQWEWNNPRLNVLLEEANIEIGNLKSYSELIPNIDLYIKMHIKMEANKSNRIEGTQTSIEEELMPIMEVSPEKRNDVREVQNYIDALQYSVDRIIKEDFPLSSRLIKEIHKELMKGVRGERKTPGEYRISQNWIGGSMPSNAVYVPPAHIHIQDLISDMEKFIHNDNIFIPKLIRIAMIHYQFESIHPFLDGNGRVGRIIIPLYLLSSKMLSKPCFYISDYFERYRTEYYEALNRVRLYNDMTGWINFFLQATIETAKTARRKFEKAVIFVEKMNKNVDSILGKNENVRKILDNFYENPIQETSELIEKIKVSKATINRTIASMIKQNIITETTGNSRNRIYVMEEYLNIFKK
jgi:toxin-antitoxin system, toxin component, fic family